MAKKLAYISALQSFGIFLIVLEHSRPSTEATPDGAIWCVRMIQSFSMPMFMVLSGFLFYYTNENREIHYGKYLWKKILRLLVPFWILSSVAFVPKVVLSDNAMRPIDFTWTDYFHGYLYPHDNPIILFWFIPTVFLIFLYAPILRRVAQRSSVWINILVLCALVAVFHYAPVKSDLFCLRSATVYTCFFFAGILQARYRDHFKWLASPYATFVLMLIVLSLNLIPYYVWPIHWKLVTATFGVPLTFSVSHLISRHAPWTVAWMQGYSYQIYLLSWFFQASARLGFQKGLYDARLCFLLMVVGGMVGPVYFTKVWQKYIPALSFVLGRQPPELTQRTCAVST